MSRAYGFRDFVCIVSATLISVSVLLLFLDAFTIGRYITGITGEPDLSGNHTGNKTAWVRNDDFLGMLVVFATSLL